jgi:hypothetical protein
VLNGGLCTSTRSRPWIRSAGLAWLGFRGRWIRSRVAHQIVSPTLQREIDRQLARVVLERDDVLEVVEGELGGTVSSGIGG